MHFTRRSALKIGLAGVLMTQGAVVSAGCAQDLSFDSWRRNFESDILARMEAAGVVGASVAITSRNEALRYAASFGFADLGTGRKLTVHTPMHTASISKLFTATALVQLFERAGHDLHADVNDFIDFPVTNPHHPHVPITPHHLITHTSSISDEGNQIDSFPGDPTQNLADLLRNYLVAGGRAYSPTTSFLAAEPGTSWSYSNMGVALAGYVVESVSNQSFSSYVAENFFQPIGIQNAHWYIRDFAPDVLAKPYRLENREFLELPQQGYPDVPAGMLRCSINDLAKSLHAMLGQETGAKSILSPETVRKMLSRQVDRKIYPYQGLGWTQEETRKRKVVGHTGSDVGASNIDRKSVV